MLMQYFQMHACYDIYILNVLAVYAALQESQL